MTQRIAGTDYRHLYSNPDHWPDPSSQASDTFLPQPRYENDLLAWWESFLWAQYRKDNWNGGTAKPQEFWGQVSTSELLMALCRERPSLRLHHLLVHLYFNARIFEKAKSERVRIFGVEGSPRYDGTRERRLKRQDLRRLATMQVLMEELNFPDHYFSQGTWWRPGEYWPSVDIFLPPKQQDDFHRDTEQTLPTFNKILAEALRVAALGAREPLTPQEAQAAQEALYLRVLGEAKYAELRAKEPAKPIPKQAPQRHRKPRYSGADANVYLILVVEFLREDDAADFPWTDAFEILQHFNPTLIKDLFKPRSTHGVRHAVGPTALAERIKKFRTPKDDTQRAHIEVEIQRAKAWHRNASTLAICPDPPFLMD